MTKPQLPAGFKDPEVRTDVFGTLYVNGDGRTFRDLGSATPTQPIALKRKFLAASGNPATK